LRSGIVARLLRAAPPVGPSQATVVSLPRLVRRETSPLGTTLYVELRLGDEGSAPPLTGIFIPKGFRSSAAVDVIVYLHGHKTGHYWKGPEMAIDRYWSERTSPQAPLREGVAASRKSVILVAPTLGPKSQASALARPGGLDLYLKRVLHALGAHGTSPSTAAPKLRHLVLAAHSGGGIWMLKMARGNDVAAREHLRQCWGFDSFYHPAIETRDWPDWARRYPDKTLFGYFATDACKDGRCYGPRTVACRIEKNGPPPNLRMLKAKKQGDHFGPLRDHFRERIASAAFLAPSG
jgi:hypothetical protein